MPFICVICKDALTSVSDYQIKSEDESKDEENILITTKCGHLYHKACLTAFFSTQRKDDEDNGRMISPTLCPKCRRVVVLNSTIRIFPEEDDDAYSRLLKEKCDIHQENMKLKTENKDLVGKLKSLQKTMIRGNSNNVSFDTPTNGNTCNCHLKEGDRIVSFTDNTEEILQGIVKTLGYKNNSLNAEILFESGETCLIPVAELILHEDYYGDSASESQNALLRPTGDQVPDNSNFKRYLRIYNAQFNRTKSTLEKLYEEVELFSLEQIDGVTFYIESQKTKAASLRRQLITLDASIQKLRTMHRELLETADETELCDNLSLESEEGIAQLEVYKGKALVTLKNALQFYNTALTQMQKIKPFIKGGFRWLEILETKVKDLKQDKNADLNVQDQDQIASIDEEIQSRRLLITRISQALEKFQTIPNSKLAQKDHALLNSAFSRFKNIVAEFEIRKSSKQ